LAERGPQGWQRSPALCDWLPGEGFLAVPSFEYRVSVSFLH